MDDKNQFNELLTMICAWVKRLMSASKGFKTYGQAAVDALLKEFSQLNDLKVLNLSVQIHLPLLRRNQRSEPSTLSKKSDVERSKDVLSPMDEDKDIFTPGKKQLIQQLPQKPFSLP